MQTKKNIISLMGNLESGLTYINVKNKRNPTKKCKSGIYLYNNPLHAENSCENINIGGIEYKIMFMCRVNPKNIRQPENFEDCWILSPTSDNVRPYKILIKKIPISSMALYSNQNIIILNYPNNYYFEILQNKDESYFLKNNLGCNNYDFILKEYTNGPICYDVNGYLRNGILNRNKNEIQSIIWCLHKAITESIPNVINGTTVYRGIKVKIPNNVGIGKKFYFPEFLSTSKDINISKGFASNGTLMIIYIQNNFDNGKKNYCKDVEYLSYHPNEKEVIITANCQFKIANIQRNINSMDIMNLICEGYNFNI